MRRDDWLRCGAAGSAIARDREAHGGALARLALRPDPAAVSLHEHARDGQPEAATTAVARAARVGAMEALEDALELVLLDAGPRVGDRELDLFAQHPHPDRDRIAVARVVHGVADEVAEHLRDPVEVRVDEALGVVDAVVARPEQREVARRVLE